MKRTLQYFSLALMIIAISGYIGCAGEGSGVIVQEDPSKKEDPQITVQTATEVEELKKKIADLKEELNKSNERIIESVNQTNKQYVEKMEALISQYENDIQVQEALQKKKDANQAAKEEFDAAKQELATATATAQTSAAALKEAQDQKTAEEAAAQKALDEKKVSELEIILQRGGAWEISDKNAIPFKGGTLEVRFKTEQYDSNPVKYGADLSSFGNLNNLNIVGGYIDLKGGMNLQKTTQDKDLLIKQTDYWSICYQGINEGDLFEIGGVMLKIDGAIKYHLASAGAVLKSGTGCLEFSPYDTGIIVHTKTADKDNAGTDATIQVGIKKSSSTNFIPLTTHTDEGPKQTFETVSLSEEKVFIDLDDRWDNFNKGDDEWFFSFTPGVSLLTGDVYFRIKDKDSDGWGMIPAETFVVLYNPSNWVPSLYRASSHENFELQLETDSSKQIYSIDGDQSDDNSSEMITITYASSKYTSDIKSEFFYDKDFVKNDNRLNEKILPYNFWEPLNPVTITFAAAPTDSEGCESPPEDPYKKDEYTATINASLVECTSAETALNPLETIYPSVDIKDDSCNAIEAYYKAAASFFRCQTNYKLAENQMQLLLMAEFKKNESTIADIHKAIEEFCASAKSKAEEVKKLAKDYDDCTKNTPVL